MAYIAISKAAQASKPPLKVLKSLNRVLPRLILRPLIISLTALFKESASRIISAFLFSLLSFLNSENNNSLSDNIEDLKIENIINKKITDSDYLTNYKIEKNILLKKKSIYTT